MPRMIIGGSPSTGSSLLARIFNRHSQIVCGPETSLFARPDLIQFWHRCKHRTYSKSLFKLKNPGWHRYYGISLDEEFYGVDRKRLRELVRSSADYGQFISRLENIILLKYGKTQWFEKTPSNVNSFRLIRDVWPHCQFVLCVRDPYDTIASLVDRGYSVLYSTALYLMNNAFGYMREIGGFRVCRYEELVKHPEETLNMLLEGNHIEIEPGMWVPENKGIGMVGWKLDESGPIQLSQIGRFDNMPNHTQASIQECIQVLSIRRDFSYPFASPAFYSIQSICDAYDYNFRPVSPGAGSINRFKMGLLSEKIIRTLWHYPTHFLNFPIEIA